MKADTAATLGALADPTREAIVRLLAERERSVGELADQLPVSRPAVSKQLRLLEAAGDLFTTGPTGTNVMDLVLGIAVTAEGSPRAGAVP